MRKVIVFMMVTFLLTSENFCQQRGIIQNIATDSSVEIDNVTHTDVDTHQQFISEANRRLFDIGENSTNSYNIISSVRLLPTNTNTLYIKHIVKNQFSICKVILSICCSQKLHNGYYTYGLGNLRI